MVTTSDSPSTLFCSSFGLSRHDAVVTTSDSPAPFVLLSASPVMMQWSPHRILQLHLFFFSPVMMLGFSISICSSFGLSRHDAVVTTSDSPSPFVLLSASPVMMQWSPHRICSSFGLSRHDAVVTTSDSPSPFVLLSASPVMMQWSPHRILQLH